MVLAGTTLKLVSLAIKTLSKPVAKQFKASAENSPFWRNVFSKYAQWHYKVEYQITVRLLGHHARNVKPLDENAAVKLGSEVLSEAFVFAVAGGLVIFEYNRSSKSSAAKKLEEERILQEKETEIDMRLQSLEAAIVQIRDGVDTQMNALQMIQMQLDSISKKKE
jgi:hypothetical protein